MVANFLSGWPLWFKIGIGLLLVGFGYGLATWRHQSRIAGYDTREQERMASITEKEAEQNKLRGENEQLRKDIAELSASEEGLKALIAERGGNIALEGKKLEQINEQLKNDEAVVSAPADRCVRCRRFSTTALAAKLIDRPLACDEECGGANR